MKIEPSDEELEAFNCAPPVPIMYLAKELGMPPFIFNWKMFRRLQKPTVYVWNNSDGVIEYIGLGRNGAGRPFANDHHVLHRMQPGDALSLWPQKTSFGAEQLEADLIARFKPRHNAGARRKQDKFEPSYASFFLAQRERLRKKVEDLKWSLKEAQGHLNTAEEDCKRQGL